MARVVSQERKTETEREQSRRSCQRHLKDLARVHVRPPPDVRVKTGSVPARFASADFSSNCTSPGALCAELMS